MEDFSYDALVRAVARLHAQASFLRVEVIGRSVCGRGLFALHFGKRQGGALYVAGFDCSSRASGAALLQWAQTICQSVQTETPLCGIDLTRALLQCGVTVIPCLNPDGMEIDARGAAGAGGLRRFVQRQIAGGGMPWTTNAAGAALDRQFPFAFDLLAQQQALYDDGALPQAPLSEPEARALSRLCRRERFARALVLEAGTPLLSVFPAAIETDVRETAVTSKLLAACAGVPFILPTAQESCGMFAPWFAEAMRKNAFALSLENDAASYYRRTQEMLALFAVL